MDFRNQRTEYAGSIDILLDVLLCVIAEHLTNGAIFGRARTSLPMGEQCLYSDVL